MSDTELDSDYWRIRLRDFLAELDEAALTGDPATAPVELDQSRVGRLSRMDAMQGQAMSQAARRRRGQLRQRVAAALARLDAGEFGWCLQCGEAIAPERLQVDPTAPLCIGCAQRTGR